MLIRYHFDFNFTDAEKFGKGNDYFLSLHEKSKQRYKVKINNIQLHDNYQMKTEERSGDISKFPLVQ